jgi:hypothetical protein
MWNLTNNMKRLLFVFLCFISCWCCGQCDDDLFLADMAKPQFAKAIKGNPALMDSWKILKDAERATLKTDPAVLEKMNTLLQNPNIDKLVKIADINTANRVITNKTELLVLVGKVQGAAGDVAKLRMSTMPDLLDDLDYFATNFSDTPGAGEFIKELTESAKKMSGGAFVLSTLRKNADKLGTIKKFEATIENETDEIGDIVVDVISDDELATNVFNEFKNWGGFQVSFYPSFVRQFSGYLTIKGTEFRYFFKKGTKTGEILTDADLKTAVRAALKDQKTLLNELPQATLLNVFNVQRGGSITDADLDVFLDVNFSKIFKLLD